MSLLYLTLSFLNKLLPLYDICRNISRQLIVSILTTEKNRTFLVYNSTRRKLKATDELQVLPREVCHFPMVGHAQVYPNIALDYKLYYCDLRYIIKIVQWYLYSGVIRGKIWCSQNLNSYIMVQMSCLELELCGGKCLRME